MGYLKRSTIYCLFGVASLILGGSLGSEFTHAAGAAGFCREKQVRDLSAPLASLPDIHRVPASGRLLFSSSKVEMLPLGSDGVIAGAGQAGVFLSVSQPAHLSWAISASLARVNRNGRRLGRSRHRGWTVKVSNGEQRTRSFAFHVGGRPALYRYDISISSASGNQLAHYAEYFRVMQKEVKADLKLNAATYRPGARLFMHLRNRGTAAIYYGYELVIERWTGVEWVEDPSTPAGWPLVGLGLGGGAVGDCESVTLGSVSGEYRITKRYSPRIAGREVPVHARFSIIQ